MNKAEIFERYGIVEHSLSIPISTGFAMGCESQHPWIVKTVRNDADLTKNRVNI